MSSAGSNPALTPSLVDRLIDPQSTGTSWRRGFSVRQMVESVRRDLEDLLNTRAARISLPAEFQELNQSSFLYGLPDFSSVETSTHNDRQRLAEMIERIVTRFEPRLRDVRTILIDQGEDSRRTITFHVSGRLSVDPAAEVSFETVLELASGHAQVNRRER